MGSTEEGAAVCAWEGQTGLAEKVPVSPNPNASHVCGACREWIFTATWHGQRSQFFFNCHILNTSNAAISKSSLFSLHAVTHPGREGESNLS